MTRFVLSDKDFESCKMKIGKSEKCLELFKHTKDEYVILEHRGDSVYERGDYTKEELKTIWLMLTTKQ